MVIVPRKTTPRADKVHMPIFQETIVSLIHEHNPGITVLQLILSAFPFEFCFKRRENSRTKGQIHGK